MTTDSGFKANADNLLRTPWTARRAFAPTASVAVDLCSRGAVKTKSIPQRQCIQLAHRYPRDSFSWQNG